MQPKNIILNEKAHVERLLAFPSEDNVTGQNVWMVARYYNSAGYDKKKIRGLVEDFLVRNDPQCNLVQMGDMIDRAVKDSGRRQILELNSIPVTYAELKLVDELEVARERKILFTLICLAKYSNAVSGTLNGWVNYPLKDIFYLANTYNLVKPKMYALLHDLGEQRLIGFSRRIDNTNIQVKCLNYDSDPKLQIYSFRDLGNQYLKYKGEPFFECQSCGAFTRRTNRSQRYCVECGKEINRSRAYERWLMS